jgi:hypothetical protein
MPHHIASPAPDLAVWGQVPAVEIVDRIVVLADPTVRNLQITQSYCEFSQALSRGNRKVFEEIGREFARFAATFRDDAVFDVGEIARFCEALKPGEPSDGQDYLRRALTHLYRARYAGQPKAKRESGADDWSDLNDRMHFIADLFRAYQE